MEIIQSTLLSSIPGLKHGFFRPGIPRHFEKNMSFKHASPEIVLQARQTACDLLGISYEHLTHVYQEHGTEIVTVREKHRGAGALTGQHQIGKGDALITEATRVPIAILIADCLPIFYASSDASVVGLAHAGWRGTFNDIAGKMVQKLKTEFSIPPFDLKVWIGPGISIRGFTVKNDVWDLFREQWHRYEDCYDIERMAIDLKRLNRYRLEETGIPPENIEIAPDCTFSDPRFFSYRRDGKGSGHNMAVIVRE